MSPWQGPQSAVRTSTAWYAYFRDNRLRPIEIPWAEGIGDAAEQIAAITASLRAWQLGETSDGAHLLQTARRYAEQVQDAEFIRVIELFIAEEQRHGAQLGRFLDLAGVPRARSDWGDWVFRKIRYAVPSMEMWATPVVMVETIAVVYFNALRQATSSVVLRRLCEQILRDEVAHIRFQCERLAILHRHRPSWLYALTMLLHRVFFLGITLAVWVGHRRGLQAGGYGFTRYWRSAWSKMNHAWRSMDPQGYSWAEDVAENAHGPIPAKV